jgi:hypothetical protein
MAERGAELARWLAFRVSLEPGSFDAARCFLALDPEERKSLMEKERLGRVSWAPSIDDLLLVGTSSPLGTATADVPSGVPGLLTKKTLSSSLEVSATSSA